MSTAVKICGIKSVEAIAAASRAGATHIGFNFYPGSPRYIEPAKALELAALAPTLKSVALTVDADDATLDNIVAQARPAFLQLHGDETTARVTELKARHRLPIIKAIAIETANDVKRARLFETVADILLFDAKPALLPGGNGLAFDWQLIANEEWTTPWMLSGGLNATNVAQAIHKTRARAVDVSSGVEKSRGEKDPELIEHFTANAYLAFAESHSK